MRTAEGIPEKDLCAQLNKIYKVVCFTDIASVTDSPSLVFKLLDKYRKDAFASNERLVLYTNECPSFKLLGHIQKAASVIDIGNYFILICCPFDITESLSQLSKQYGFDTPMGHFLTSVGSSLPLSDKFYVADTVCPEAWQHLEVKNSGNIHPCCIQTDVVGNIINDTLADVFYNDAMTTLRSDLLSGVKVAGCNYCWSTESNGLVSNRQQHLNLNAKEFYTNWIDKPAIRSLDVKPGNTCNFKCRTCTPGASSLHASEALTYETDTNKIIKIKNHIVNGKWFDDGSVTSQLDELLLQLTNLDIYGGEPFLLKNLPPLLQKAVDLDLAKNIRLHFNSNGSIFPETLVPLFKYFKDIDIALSIDNIGKRFELERGGDWEVVEQNVIKFSSLPIRTYIFPTINIQNILYLDELLDWAEEIGIDVTCNLLHDPEHFNINYMTEDAKQLVVERLSNSKHEILRTFSEQVSRSKGSDGSEFVRHVKEYDFRRNEDFSITHPEIAKAMGYIL